jgi:hypothetical protein
MSEAGNQPVSTTLAASANAEPPALLPPAQPVRGDPVQASLWP